MTTAIDAVKAELAQAQEALSAAEDDFAAARRESIDAAVRRGRAYDALEAATKRVDAVQKALALLEGDDQ